MHNANTTQNSKLWGKLRKPVPAEIQLCTPHITELLAAQNYTHIACFGKDVLAHCKTLTKRPILELPDLTKLADQDYLLLPIIKAGRKLSQWITRHNHSPSPQPSPQSL